MKAYFVSDIHIQEPDDSRAQLFEAFLRALQEQPPTHLFLLGDIFDLWVADHQFFVQKYHGIIRSLKELLEKGVRIHYFEGNHDLHLERFWQNELGVAVHSGPETLFLGDLRVRVEHGDEMDPEDRGYRFLRFFLRTQPMKWLAHHLPTSLVVGLGKKSSAESRRYTTYTHPADQEEILSKLHRHALKVWSEEPFDLLICGHIHVREDVKLKVKDHEVRVVNLGTWLKDPTYFVVDEEGQYFVEWV